MSFILALSEKSEVLFPELPEDLFTLFLCSMCNITLNFNDVKQAVKKTALL